MLHPIRSRILGTTLGLLMAGPLVADPPSLGLDRFPEALAQTAPQARPHTLKSTEATLPDKVDLSSLLPPVQGQGEIGSCAAWSTVYYARTLLEQKYRHWGTSDRAHEFSPLYSYNQITKGQNVGTAIEDHMQILKDQGIVSLADFPYVDKLDVQPGDALIAQAGRYKIEGYKTLPRVAGAVDLNAIKSFLAEGVPVVGGFDLFDDFPNYQGGIYQTTSGTTLGGHAMAIVGYDDQRQALRIVNSWGPQWGDQGFAWISYESVRAMTRNNYGFAVMFEATSESPVPQPPQDLAATKGQFEDSIALTWSPQDHVSYTVFRADNATQDWKRLGTTTQGSYTDTNLPPGVTYVYAVGVEGNPTKSPVAEGWTQKKATVPGIVQGVTSLRYGASVILVWPGLADTETYKVFRFDPATQEFVLWGTTTQPVFRDDAGFGNDTSITYFVQGSNAQGDGLPSDHLQVLQDVPPAQIQAALSPALVQKLSGQKAAPRGPKPPYHGAYYQADWFDPATLKKAFQDYAAQEKKAFEDWKKKDQEDFDQFLKTEGEVHPAQ